MKVLSCCKCYKPMGEITKGRMKKDLRYICQSCLSLLLTKPKQHEDTDFASMFDDMFGEMKK